MSNLANYKPWIFILTHGKFGEELRNSAEMIMGKLDNVYCFSLLEEMEPKDLINQINKVIIDAPKNSLFLTDLYGGTPSNVAATFAREYSVISGINLPMLIEAEMLRSQKDWDQIVDKILFSATDGIKNITQIMKERQAK